MWLSFCFFFLKKSLKCGRLCLVGWQRSRNLFIYFKSRPAHQKCVSASNSTPSPGCLIFLFFYRGMLSYLSIIPHPSPTHFFNLLILLFIFISRFLLISPIQIKFVKVCGQLFASYTKY